MSILRVTTSLLPTVFLGLVILTSSTGSVLAQVCPLSCEQNLVQVTVYNGTLGWVQLEGLLFREPSPMLPGEEFQLQLLAIAQPNLVLSFRDITGLLIQAVVSQSTINGFRIDRLPKEMPPGDRSVHIQSDGSITVF